MGLNSAICIVVDRFHAGMLGPYGNTWIRTPGLNRLAGDGFVFDQAFADSTRLESLYRAYWRGVPAGSRAAHGGPSLARVLADAGFSTTLVTDDKQVGRLRGAEDFDERVGVEANSADAPADDESETGLGRFFATAAECLQNARPPFFLWLHSRGMGGPWDAPLTLRNQYVDEEDPLPPRFTAVPSLRLPEDPDPDKVLGFAQAYAGQISLLDICLDALIDPLREGPLAHNTLLVLLGARGFPLGEHGHVGPWDDALHNETVQVPWLMRFPGGEQKLGRSQALVEPADLPGTVLDWCCIDRDQWPGHESSKNRGRSLLPMIRGETVAWRDHIAIVSRTGAHAIRTPAWHLMLAAADAERPQAPSRLELYAKPSDRWEVNEVADRCPEIAAGLAESLLQALERGDSADLPPLAEPLVTEVD